MKHGYGSVSSFVKDVKAAKQPICMIIMGLPGSGKGINATQVANSLGIAHVETGAMIRKELKSGSPLGNQMKEIVQAGNLVPDEIIYKLIEQRLTERDCAKGILFDGMPRTIAQAQKLDEILARFRKKVTLVLNLDAPDAVVIQRMRKRATIEKRPDDSTPGVIENRVKIYHDQSDPIIDFYKRKKLLVRVNAEKSPQKVFKKVNRRIRVSELKRTAKATGTIARQRFARILRRNK
jgi:adenylate kinase